MKGKKQKRKRLVKKVHDFLTDANLEDSDDEKQVIMNVINKRSLMNKLKDKINDHRVNSGRKKKMSLETKKIAYQFWHDNCTVSTITTKHA